MFFKVCVFEGNFQLYKLVFSFKDFHLVLFYLERYLLLGKYCYAVTVNMASSLSLNPPVSVAVNIIVSNPVQPSV